MEISVVVPVRNEEETIQNLLDGLPGQTRMLMLVARGLVAIWRNRNCYPAGVGRNICRLGILVPLIAVLDAAALIGLQWFLKDKVDATIGVTDGA